MKGILIASSVLAAAALSVPTAASADSFSIRIGDGYRHHHRHHYFRHHRGFRAYDRYCRVVVTHRYRHGNRITVRKRICD